MKVVYAPKALRDIDDILTYIHQRSLIGAPVENLGTLPDDE